MRIKFFLLILALTVFGLSGCESKPQTIEQAAASRTPVIPKDGVYRSKGTVTKVNNELGSIELDHPAIPGLMPAMIMEFFVKDKAMIDGLATGDIVHFDVEYKHPSETIVRIEKVK